MSKHFRQMNEGFEWVFKANSIDEQVSRLKEWAARCQCLVPVVRIGVGAEKPNWDLPEGMPNLSDIERDIPDGMGETSIQMEWRRISQFFTPGSNLNNLPRVKRESVGVNIWEGIHHTEADLLTAVKDGKLLSVYPQLEALMKPLGITEYNKTEEKKKTKKK